jgi:two-component system chemotaxis response regulator CheY
VSAGAELVLNNVQHLSYADLEAEEGECWRRVETPEFTRHLNRGKAASGTESSPEKGMRVLIADDEKSVGTTLADLVRHCNHEVVEIVESGFEAIQAYSRHHPDVVVMDYWMSKLNGATACRNILAKDPAARIILVSGWSPIIDLTESGAVAVLSKPITMEMLTEALSAAVESSPMPVEWVAALN